MRELPASKSVNTEVEESAALKPLPDNDWRKHSRLRRLITCCSELMSVLSRDNAVVTCSYDL